MIGDLLRLTQKPLSEQQRKDILRQALTGLAALHDRHIIHTGKNTIQRWTKRFRKGMNLTW